MTKGSDQTYLLNNQYRDAANLNARINLHTRFTTNPYDWFRFIFDHFTLPDNATLVELGCGPGMLWVRNLERIPPCWDITLSDFSPGMLEEAQKNLVLSSHHFKFELIDAQRLPIQDEYLDAVVANHMLYHVPDRPRAFSEIHRVLKPGGFLFAATNGEKHLMELRTFYEHLKPELSFNYEFDHTFSAGAFTLENGPDQLSPWFTTVVYNYEDALMITETEPLVAYLLSMIPPVDFQISQQQIATLTREIEAQIQNKGGIYISKSSGLLIAQKTYYN